MSSARKLEIDALTDEELDRLADRIDKRREERRLAKRRPAKPPPAPVSDTDAAYVRRKAREWGLIVKVR